MSHEIGVLKLNHTVVTAVDGDLGTGGGGEDGAGDGADHGSNSRGGDLNTEQVFSLIFLHGHAVALGGVLEGFLAPNFGVEDGIGVEDIDANAVGRELEGGDSGKLGDSRFGDGVGGCAWAGGGVVPRTDDDDRGVGPALEMRDGKLEEALGGGEIDLEVEVPAF
jgi:hypothetical protein